MLKKFAGIVLVVTLISCNTVLGQQYIDLIKNISGFYSTSEVDSSYLSPLVLQLSDKEQQKAFLEQFSKNPQQLDSVTDFAKAALQLTAVGKNANPYINEILTAPSLNSPAEAAWSLLAVNSTNYDLPKDAVWDKDKLVSYMLSSQLPEGGFGYAEGQFDIDTTAVILSALAPFRENNAEVQQAVDKAIQKLSEVQGSDGNFSPFGIPSSDSLSSVITALSKCGIDANSDSRFVKEGKGLVDLLLGYKTDGNMFGMFDNISGNTISTNNAAEALAAYDLFKSDKGVYEFKKLNFFQKIFGNFNVIRNDYGEPKKSFIQKIVEFIFRIEPKSKVNEDYSNSSSESIGIATVSIRVDDLTLFESDQFQINKNDTAFSVLMRAVSLNGLSVVWEGNFPSIYVKSIGDFSAEGGRGWMYLLNGEALMVSSGQANVNNGDSIEWTFK